MFPIIGNMEEWARTWLENQRDEGKTCLEIKMLGSNYYVYHSTNRYDKEIKKGRKVSKYLGKLDKGRGFIPKGQNKQTAACPRNITEYPDQSRSPVQRRHEIADNDSRSSWQCEGYKNALSLDQ